MINDVAGNVLRYACECADNLDLSVLVSTWMYQENSAEYYDSSVINSAGFLY